MKNPSSKEQQADKLWKDFDPDKENEFWKKYEALLQSRQFSSAVVSQASVPAQPANSLQKFYPYSAFYVWRVLLILLGLCLLYPTLRYFVQHNMHTALFEAQGSQFLYLIILVFFVLVGCGIFFGVPVLAFVQLKAFATSESGLYIFNPLGLKKKNYIEWADMELIKLDVVRDAEGGVSGNLLNIVTSKKGTLCFDYYLGGKTHQDFFRFVRKKNIKIEDKSLPN